MLKPAIGDLLKKTETRFALVIAVAKRARQLSEDEIIKTSSMKTVSMAIKEIDEDEVSVIIS